MGDNNALYFDPKQHRYTDYQGVPFTSQTQINGLYEAKKDFIAIATACEAIGKNPNHVKYKKYRGKSKTQLLLDWKIMTDIALASGNQKHDYLESTVDASTGMIKKVAKRKSRVKLFTILDVIEDKDKGQYVDLSKLDELQYRFPLIYSTLLEHVKDGWKMYSEVGVFNTKYRVAGLIDLLLFKYPYFFIIDWKTNKAKIMFDAGYFEKDINGALTETFIYTDDVFNYPLDYMPCSVGNKYAMQLSGYTFMVEEFGLKQFRPNQLFHIREAEAIGADGNPFMMDDLPIKREIVDEVETPYLRSEVLAMFEHFRKVRLNLK